MNFLSSAEDGGEDEGNLQQEKNASSFLPPVGLSVTFDLATALW